MSSPLVVSDVSKAFRLPHEQYHTLKERVLHPFKFRGYNQLDALKEVENIGAGHAATALSQMTNRRIMISVPKISVTRLEDVAELLGDPREVVAAPTPVSTASCPENPDRP